MLQNREINKYIKAINNDSLSGGLKYSAFGNKKDGLEYVSPEEVGLSYIRLEDAKKVCRRNWIRSYNGSV